MVSQRPRRYLQTFLDPAASFSQSMSPYRSTTTPFTPEIITCLRTCTSRTPLFSNSTSIFDFLPGTLRGLDPPKKMRIECLHLPGGWYRGSISHQRSNYIGFCPRLTTCLDKGANSSPPKWTYLIEGVNSSPQNGLI